MYKRQSYADMKHSNGKICLKYKVIDKERKINLGKFSIKGVLAESRQMHANVKPHSNLFKLVERIFSKYNSTCFIVAYRRFTWHQVWFCLFYITTSILPRR